MAISNVLTLPITLATTTGMVARHLKPCLR